ncbi:MAG: flavin oxidoreductase/NADH oxidase [Spirochaetia bacterium]|jgi:2,4-dienoyl-CoA reductase-like NADH-dependent reductase (Old Yellow Enzyme family)|nr:flavin oxidoreductase/NADH oxidase [Spirochaetia bacterium]
MKHEKFHYKNVEDILAAADKLSVHLPFAKDTSILKTPLKVNGTLTLQNRMGIAPMEGADSYEDGSPSELTTTRYVNEAIGGSAIIWFEAISIVPEGRSSSHQLMLDKNNLEAYKKFTRTIKEAGIKANGFAPYLVMQANHSGRYSNPNDKAAPLIAYRHPIYEKLRGADDSCIVSDAYLESLEEKFGEASKLAKEAGFDAVDIKSCHGYLLAELLSAYNRPGLYGGSLENRTRLLRNGISAAKVYEDKDFMVTARLGIYDGFAWPYGFGVKQGEGKKPDFSEPISLVRTLHETYGLNLVDLTMGNPYVSIHVTRPFDMGKYVPDEHPLEGEARMINGIGEIKKAVPDLKILASAPSYLRQFSDLYSAGAIEEGLCDGMLFGRMSFADPAFPNQIIHDGRIDASKTCVTCGKCGDLIRAKKPTGCVIRNSKMYLGYYKEYLAENK